MSSRSTKPSQGRLGNWSHYPASTTPNRLDVVWCWFPETKELNPAPKPRPGLVRRVLKGPDGKIAVEVAYGTSNLKADRGLSHQLVLSHSLDLEEAGLRAPTRFDLVQTKLLPWCREFFGELRPGDGAIIGRLSANKRLDLNEMAAALPAPAAEVRKAVAFDGSLRAGLLSPDIAAPSPPAAHGAGDKRRRRRKH
jgi:hypothetical protein